MTANGLEESEIGISQEAIQHIIRYYTREAGVRSLEREISKIFRKVVTEILLKTKLKIRLPRLIGMTFREAIGDGRD